MFACVYVYVCVYVHVCVMCACVCMCSVCLCTYMSLCICICESVVCGYINVYYYVGLKQLNIRLFSKYLSLEIFKYDLGVQIVALK